MNAYVPDVRVVKNAAGDWLVWLDGKIVERFIVAGDALALASILECSPRARAAAIAA
jgi:hypothetical protein